MARMRSPFRDGLDLLPRGPSINGCDHQAVSRARSSPDAFSRARCRFASNPPAIRDPLSPLSDATRFSLTGRGVAAMVDRKSKMTQLFRLLVIGFSLCAASTQTEDNESLLHDAVEAGDRAKVEALLAKGVNVNAKFGSGYTPLHTAASEGKTDIAKL